MTARAQGVSSSRVGSTRTVIESGDPWWKLGLGELLAYKELLYFLTLRNIRVRYKQTILGPAWVVIQPLVFTVTFYFVFRKIGRVDVPAGIPYALFAMVALVPWNLFQQSVTSISESLTGSAPLISKVYFPRLVGPLSFGLSHVLDFVVGLGLVAVSLVIYRQPVGLRLLWVPVLSLLLLSSCFAVGVWLAALNARYRDVRYALRPLLQLLLFASPIGYSSQELTGAVRLAYGLNPMTGLAEGFRWAVLGIENDPGPLIAIGGAVTAVLLLSGLIYFKHVEQNVADVI